MPNTRYAIYRQSVIDFTKTIVIKSTLAANSINNNVLEQRFEVETQYPESWRYYKNIAGEYHITDTMMSIVSLDTLETINFTKTNLEIHRATAKGYEYGSRYYNELVAKYPNQEMLIRGILHPVDIDAAIAAEDGAILYYDATHIEENEYDLMGKLQQWIYGFLIRWNVQDYHLSNDLYPAALLGIIFSQMPGYILDLRTSFCKTNQAHTYHIREYLASHGKLDRYMDILSKKQALFLYRNILYINHNAGLQSTFELLVDRLLTERNIPISSYDIRHNVTNMPAELDPIIELAQFPINMQHVEGRDDVLDVRQLLEKIVDNARDNEFFLEADIVSTTRSMERSAANQLNTKVLESVVVDDNDEGPFAFADTLLNHWLYLSVIGRYKAVVTYTDPENGEKQVLSAKDAFSFYLYCFNKAMGVTFDTVPKLEASLVRRVPTPSLSTLKAIVDPKYVGSVFLQKLLDGVTAIPTILSNEKFYETTSSIHQRLLKHRIEYANVEHFEAHGMAKAAAMHLYCDYPCTLSNIVLWEDWLTDKGIDVDGWSENDFSRVSAELLVNATGTSNNTAKTLRDIQEGTIKILAQLSSYTLEFVSTINTEPYRPIDWSMITLGDIFAREMRSEYWPMPEVSILDIHAKPQDHTVIDILSENGIDPVFVQEANRFTMDITTGAEITTQGAGLFYHEHSSIGIMNFETELLPYVQSPNDLGFAVDNNPTSGFDPLLELR